MSASWANNLRALEARQDPGCRRLLAALKASDPAPDLGLRSRLQEILPGRTTQDGPRSLVSAYEPVREAQRWSSDLSSGTLALMGAGGIELYSALVARGCRLAFWVEPRLEVWRSLFTWQDWTKAAADPDWVPVFEAPEQWGETLRNRYSPLWDGGFLSREWRSAVQGQEGLWDDYRDQARLALDALASDASTQARFGERWYRNTLANLKRLERGGFPSCAGSRVVIAGAGPGLDEALEASENQSWLARRADSGGRLFCTDTALPALYARGVLPDLVLCLDGQLPSYHHFVSPPPAVPLLADLASIPALGRLGMPMIRYLSGHPMGTVIRRFFPELPQLDGSLGNVSGLARSVALALGAAQVEAWGVDFSYRDGQTYARGTYVYDLAARKAGRLTPMEARLTGGCYGAQGLERTPVAAGVAFYTTPLLRDYRERWVRTPWQAAAVKLSHDSAAQRWEAFVAHWRERLAKLPVPSRSDRIHSFVLAQETSVQQDWWALWPLALALQRQGIDETRLPRLVIERALSFLQD